MKDCDVIQPELSAYVDGELAPRQREVVEAHLASCARCAQVLAELKTVAAGTAALPRLQTAPQFLAQVRAKIRRGEAPEMLTWFDHLFRPFSLKIPMEVAALIVIALLVIHFELPRPDETVARNQVALQANRGNQQLPTMEAKAEATTLTPAGQAENVPGESVAGNGQSVGGQGKSAATVGGHNIKFTSGSKRKVPASNAGTNGPAIALVLPAEVLIAAGEAGVDSSTIGGVVVVESRNPQEVKWRAEELAARYNGKVIAVSPLMGSNRQIIFVEMPRNDAAAFKLGLQQEPGSSALFTKVAGGVDINNTNSPLLVVGTPTTRAVAAADGVGVNSASMEAKSAANTNGASNGPPQLSLANRPQAQEAATMVLGIQVVPPSGLAPTNPTPTATPPIP